MFSIPNSSKTYSNIDPALFEMKPSFNNSMDINVDNESTPTERYKFQQDLLQQISNAGNDIDRLRELRRELDVLSINDPDGTPNIDYIIYSLKPWQQVEPDPSIVDNVLRNFTEPSFIDLRPYYDYILRTYKNPMVLQIALYKYLTSDPIQTSHINYNPLMNEIDLALSKSLPPIRVNLTRSLKESIDRYIQTGELESGKVQQAILSNIDVLSNLYGEESYELLYPLVQSALDQNVGVDVRPFISSLISRDLKYKPDLGDITPEFIQQVLSIGDTTWINNPTFRRAVIDLDIESNYIVDEIKLRYVSGPYKVSLVWLPDGRRVALFSDEHNYKGGCPSGYQTGDQLHRLFVDHPYIDFDLIAEYEKKHERQTSQGTMFAFFSEYSNCFDETLDPSLPQPYFANCPKNVHYHRIDLRTHKSEIKFTEESDVEKLNIVKWFEPIIQQYQTMDIDDTIEMLDNILQNLPMTNDNVGALKIQIDLFKDVDPDGYSSMLDVIAKRIQNWKDTFVYSERFEMAAFIMDMYAIARFERQYVDRSKQGAHEDYLRNTIIYAGGFHIITYIKYLKDRYRKGIFKTFSNDKRCIDLGKYNLSDFFSRKV